MIFDWKFFSDVINLIVSWIATAFHRRREVRIHQQANTGQEFIVEHVYDPTEPTQARGVTHSSVAPRRAEDIASRKARRKDFEDRRNKAVRKKTKMNGSRLCGSVGRNTSITDQATTPISSNRIPIPTMHQGDLFQTPAPDKRAYAHCYGSLPRKAKSSAQSKQSTLPEKCALSLVSNKKNDQGVPSTNTNFRFKTPPKLTASLMNPSVPSEEKRLPCVLPFARISPSRNGRGLFSLPAEAKFNEPRNKETDLSLVESTKENVVPCEKKIPFKQKPSKRRPPPIWSDSLGLYRPGKNIPHTVHR